MQSLNSERRWRVHLAPYFDGAILERADGAKGHTSLGALQNDCKGLAFET